MRGSETSVHRSPDGIRWRSIEERDISASVATIDTLASRNDQNVKDYYQRPALLAREPVNVTSLHPRLWYMCIYEHVLFKLLGLRGLVAPGID